MIAYCGLVPMLVGEEGGVHDSISLVRIRQYKHTNQCTDHQFTIKSLQSNGVNGQTVLIVPPPPPPAARSYTRSTIECDLSIGKHASKRANKPS